MVHDIGIVLPFYFLSDDFETDKRTLQETVTSLSPFAKRIVVVDDGTCLRSVDGARLIAHVSNMGKSAAVRTGIRALLSEEDVGFVIEIDADNDQDPKDAELFVEEFKTARYDKALLVIGDRYSAPQMAHPGRYRDSVNAIQRLLFSELHIDIRDSVSGFRGYSRVFAETIVMQSRSEGFGIASEEVVLAYLNDAPVKEIPLRYARPRSDYTKASKLGEVLEGILIHSDRLAMRDHASLSDSLRDVKRRMECHEERIRFELGGQRFDFVCDSGRYTIA